MGLPNILLTIALLVLPSLWLSALAIGPCEDALKSLQERLLAQNIGKQQRLLQSPEVINKVISRYPELDLAVISKPFGGGHGSGDFHKVIELPNGKVCILVGDVMGHGDKAAKTSLKFHNYFKQEDLLQVLHDPHVNANKILNYMDRSELVKEETLALSITILNPKTGKIDFAAAGTERTFVKSLDGTIQSYGATGAPLTDHGLYADLNHYQTSFTHTKPYLSEGDIVIQISDGAVEGLMLPNFPNKSLPDVGLQMERFNELLSKCRGCSPEEIMSRFKNEFVLDIDDITMLIYQWFL